MLCPTTLAQEPHPESLVRLPLVRQMLTDPLVRLVPRRIDLRWRDEKKIPLSIVGFNPFEGAVFYAQQSLFSRWLADPTGPTRGLNRDDRLLHDVFFAVHDYLHVWTTRLIQSLVPEVGFGTAELHRGNVEDQVFCHLLTETAATVGLDYWYLCTFDLNQRLAIGTRRIGGLATAYHERNLTEYRRFRPGLEVQCPEFFGELCRFYCSGEFVGFDAHDLAQSPLLSSWLTHEIGYGEKQREYCRLWLSYLAPSHQKPLTGNALDAPVDSGIPWRSALMTAVGEALWRKIKEDSAPPLLSSPGTPWQSAASQNHDFRFYNANADGADLLSLRPAKEAVDYEYYFCQLISRYDYAQFDPEIIKLFPLLREKKDVKLLHALLKGQRQLPENAAEPRDLLFLN